jgi:hypothetical protein
MPASNAMRVDAVATHACRRQQDELHGDQALAVQQIAERHDEQQRERAAELRRGDDAADRGRRDAELARDRIEQRLRVVHVRDARRAADREQRDGRGRHAGLVRARRRSRRGQVGAAGRFHRRSHSSSCK